MLKMFPSLARIDFSESHWLVLYRYRPSKTPHNSMSPLKTHHRKTGIEQPNRLLNRWIIQFPKINLLVRSSTW